MVLNLAVEPVSAGATQLSQYRYRPAMGERTVLPEGPQHSPANARAGDRETFSERRQPEAEEQAIASERNRAADFAAAIIAGALPPTPQSMEELLRRIGSAEIPEESQARLKDLLA